ncbi:threonine/serine exporter ThrE family protein [Cellulomonas sp. KRMCY2]|uniref:threonine/serine ThrE exporter family protein n=1 Tax=Cellulomonas sp. KRMCY2 TaxID=1304865 RepID=UPI00045E6CF5|nr:threonine/serine exporter family protein [Cellulomonas sp. KRMCY2]
MARPRNLRELVLRTLAGPATLDVGRRPHDAGLDEAVVRGAMELALRTGETVLSLGAAAAEVVAAILGITRAFGLVGCQVDVTFTAITVSYDRGGASVPITVMRVVTARVDDYGRLGRVMQLAREVAVGTDPAGGTGPTGRTGPAERIEPDDRTAHVDRPEPAVSVADPGGALLRLERAHARLDEIVTAPHPYRRGIVTVVLAVMAAGVAFLLGGGPGVAVVAGATTALIDHALWRLGRWGLPAFFRQAVGAAIATLVAVGLWLVVPLLPVDLAQFPPSLVVASGIVVLLAGLSLVGSAEDAISGFPVTAGGRAFEVVVLTIGIVAGIGAVLDVARRAGVPLEIIEVPTNTSPLVVQALSAAVVASAWGIASYARPRAALVAAVAGGVAWVIYAVGVDAGLGVAVASAAAASVIGFLSESLGSRLHVPTIVVSICGIVPLLPGLAIYRALFLLVTEPSATGGLGSGATGLLSAAMVGLGLAAGVTLGEFLAASLARLPRRSDPPG